MIKVGNKVLIVAEITTNHLGDINRLKKMVRLAKDAGADLVKIQKRNIETFYSREMLDKEHNSPFGKTWKDFRQGIELSLEDIKEIEAECKKIGIELFVSILDIQSFELLQQFDKKLLKLPSTISSHKDFHAKVAKLYKGEIVISTGYTSLDYEDYIQETFKDNEKIYLLQCTSAYPPPPEDCGISIVRHYHDLSKKNPKIIPGYSSHDIGSLGSMLAVAAGARMIEKHVKIGDTPWMHFQEVALDLENGEFAQFVKDIRQAEIMCGDEIKSVKPSEWHKYSHIPK
ncbi:MAG TPA: N-acetylneuraminate synthase family protein [Candidatus Paceibacterota bacterium]|nr:N-acetylneuraminate synthase family protein [Candidatus Paceibacterota bacterium]